MRDSASDATSGLCPGVIFSTIKLIHDSLNEITYKPVLNFVEANPSKQLEFQMSNLSYSSVLCERSVQKNT